MCIEHVFQVVLAYAYHVLVVLAIESGRSGALRTTRGHEFVELLELVLERAGGAAPNPILQVFVV